MNTTTSTSTVRNPHARTTPVVTTGNRSCVAKRPSKVIVTKY